LKSIIALSQTKKKPRTGAFSSRSEDAIEAAR
jgi:hypothetical protein